eukprot:CAMPEP_0180301288 /NCGR_PEP_ID=MMETSP0988-20121125/23383_1 /TAXON_ID=697907 /ORGANISM="non described non described, Strain CCMP2293" /LENGTH=180 /DNA_ID=CAMNT_0022281785 /DNA_START=82 /DNA_END=624 /DNA_ORIENTATION=-
MPPNLRIKPEARAIMAPRRKRPRVRDTPRGAVLPEPLRRGGGAVARRGRGGGFVVVQEARNLLRDLCGRHARGPLQPPHHGRVFAPDRPRPAAEPPVAEPPRVHVQAGEAPEPPEGDSDERPRGGGAGRLAPGEEVGGGGRAFVGGGDPLHGFEGDGCLLLLRGVGGVLLGVTVWDLETV